jgi:hypothetical protein
MVELKDSSVIEFFPLIINQERNRYGECYVGRASPGGFVALPEEGMTALRLLQQGLTLGQVAQRLVDEDGEGVDVGAFVQDLLELGFVARVDGYAVSSDLPVVPSSKRSLTTGGWPSFLKPLLVFCTVLIVAGAAALVKHPRYVPRWQDFFWHESYSLVLSVGFATGWPLLAGHELAHLGMARALGVRGDFSLDTRLWFVVGQTRFPGLWALSKRGRLLVYGAGLLHDAALVALLVLYLWFYDHHHPIGGEMAYPFAKALMLALVVRMAWQFNVYMRTDVYFMLADGFDCKNLFDDAKRYLLAQVPFFHRRDELGDLPLGERRLVRFYSLILLVGTGMALLAFALYQAPAILTLIKDSWVNLLSHPVTRWRGPQWDSVVALVLVCFEYVLLTGLLVRQRWGRLSASRGLSGASMVSH